MRKITAEELKEILRKHELWLNNVSQGEKANLYEADLYGANLYEVYLSGANLSGANLKGVDLSESNLSEADLSEANLYLANLYDANLYETNLIGACIKGANLIGANLSGAELYGACLIGANLSGADLSGANLCCTDLYGANLIGANLSEADLSGANLYEADLSGANLYEAKIDYPMICPEKGSFTGYKKCKNGLIVELSIPEDALRSSATTRKCRCSKAKVISITNLDGSKSEETEAISNRDNSFVYKLEETVEVPDFDPNRWNECSTGIHFFMTKEEALNYIY